MTNKLGVCTISSIPVRTSASEESEMCTQLLFGETYQVNKELDRWIKIVCTYDNYEGYIDKKLFIESLQSNDSVVPSCITQTTAFIQDLSSGIIFPILQGSSIYVSNKETNSFLLGSISYKLIDELPVTETLNLEKCILSYLHAPYLWGGRSPFGIDCSGFTQVVYKMFGIVLQRDASQQIKMGTLVNSREDSQLGDLAFFNNEKGIITHVGFLLNKGEVVHASGMVRKDCIDDFGIFQSTNEVYTHTLHSIRRYID